MINVVTVDAEGNERTVNMGDVTKMVDEEGFRQLAAKAGARIEEQGAVKPKRARNRVATKVTVTKTIEKELTFTEADLRRMLRIPEGATLTVARSDVMRDGTESAELVGGIVARWVVTK